MAMTNLRARRQNLVRIRAKTKDLDGNGEKADAEPNVAKEVSTEISSAFMIQSSSLVKPSWHFSSAAIDSVLAKPSI